MTYLEFQNENKQTHIRGTVPQYERFLKHTLLKFKEGKSNMLRVYSILGALSNKFLSQYSLVYFPRETHCYNHIQCTAISMEYVASIYKHRSIDTMDLCSEFFSTTVCTSHCRLHAYKSKLGLKCYVICIYIYRYIYIYI